MSMVCDKVKIVKATVGLSLLGLAVERIVDEMKIFVDELDSEVFMADLAPDKDVDLIREMQTVRAQGHAMLNAITEAAQNAPDEKAILAVVRRRIVTADMDNSRSATARAGVAS